MSPYSVRMREDTDQKKTLFGHFSRSVHPWNASIFLLRLIFFNTGEKKNQVFFKIRNWKSTKDMFNISSVLGFPQNVKNTYCMTAVTAKRKTRKDLFCFDEEVWQIFLTTNNVVTINYIKKALASLRILMW